MANEVDKELDQLRTDMVDLRKDMASLIKTMKEAGVEQGQEFYEQAAKRAKQTRDEASRFASDTYNSLEKEVEERPLTSVITAFGTGFVLGLLLDRRR